jgi:hypothetical protein
MANVPQLMAVSKHSALRLALEQPLAMVYWPYTTPHKMWMPVIKGEV